jgi:hypothetical protein
MAAWLPSHSTAKLAAGAVTEISLAPYRHKHYNRYPVEGIAARRLGCIGSNRFEPETQSMRSAILVLGACLIAVAALSAGPAEEDDTIYIDLKAKANHKLKDPFHDSNTFKENNLAALKIGVQKLGGVKFKIGEGFLQLGSNQFPDMPEKFEGIAVNRKLAMLHILHSTGYGSAAEGDKTHVPDDTLIAKYIIHYEDKSKAEIEVLFGREVRDWWYGEGDKSTDRSKVAWTGENPDCKRSGKKLRLFLTTWENPNPGKKIASIDYIATKKSETAATPFCIAMTGEAAR